jgi:hypothetical protein
LDLEKFNNEKMKKLIIGMTAMFLSLIIFPVALNAGIVTESYSSVKSTRAEPSDSVDVNALKSRLNEIKAVDKSELKASERKVLRKESNSLEAKIRHSHGGFYISGGAIIIILLIIILI